MSMPVPPPDTRAVGQVGHVQDHNTISDILTDLESAVGTIQAKFPWINVQDPLYGAKGDNVADDTAALQTAMNACAAANGGGIFLPTPLVGYKTTAPLVWTSAKPLALIGSTTKGNGNGPGGSAILPAFTGHAIDVRNASWFRMQDLDVIASIANTGGYNADHVAVYVGNVVWGEITRVNINYAPGITQAQAFVAGIKIYNCPGFDVNHAAINSSAQGVWFTGPAAGSIANLLDIENVHIGTVAGSGGAAMQMDGASGTINACNVITYQGDRAFWMTGPHPEFVFMDNIQMNNPSIAGMQFDSGSAVYLSRIWHTSFQHAAAAPVHGINIGPAFGGSFQIDNSSFGGMGGHGIWIQGGQGYTINSTQIGHAGGFASNTYDDIHIGPAASAVTIEGCHLDTDVNLTHSGSYPVRSGVYVESGATNVLVKGNLLGTGYGTAPVVNNAASGSVRFKDNPGYNPVGLIAMQPPIVASGAPIVNNTGVEATVIVTVSPSGGATSISIGGQPTGLSSSTANAVLPPIQVPAGQTITLNYTNAPTAVWFGN